MTDIYTALSAACDELTAARHALSDLRHERDMWRLLAVVFACGLALTSVCALAAVLL